MNTIPAGVERSHPPDDQEAIAATLRQYGWQEIRDPYTPGASLWRQPGQQVGVAGEIRRAEPGGEFAAYFISFGGTLYEGPYSPPGLEAALHCVGGPPERDLGTTALELLDEPEPDHDWVIPGLLEHGDRVMLTAAEGAGKSTLLRQIAVKAAAGIHPFTDERIDRVDVLYVDLENSRRHTRRQLAPLAALVERRELLDKLWVEIRASGIDLLEQPDRDWLADRVDLAQPDLLIAGPVYKMIGGDPTAEEPAKLAARFLDSLRERYGCALLIEAHTPYASGGGRRPTRPYGASLWSRWPEFGIHLDATGTLSRWRGDRDQRDWPAGLMRGGEGAWPWQAAVSTHDVLFSQLVQAVHEAGETPSVKALARIVGAPETTVRRVIDSRRDTWRAVTSGLL